LFTIEEHADGTAKLRVCDRGIGMTADSVERYFLVADASFGPSSSELEGVEAKQAIRWMTTGRFGIGALAALLLGRSVSVLAGHGDERCALGALPALSAANWKGLAAGRPRRVPHSTGEPAADIFRVRRHTRHRHAVGRFTIAVVTPGCRPVRPRPQRFPRPGQRPATNKSVPRRRT
jgi:hypothetical protein